jgi:hypothetical protein
MAALRRASVSSSTPTSHTGGVTLARSSSSTVTNSNSSSSVKLGHSPVLVNRVVVDKDRINKEVMYWRAYAAAVKEQDPDEVSATLDCSDSSGLQCDSVSKRSNAL